ncbi:MAG: 3-deoxy-manno-octulosonate cytidylyltransferase [Daejeonella sp.]
MNNILGIIPARFASTRFPGKPLIDIAGKSMIQRVYEQAKKTKSLSKVIVATDDQRIVDHVLSFGGEVIMTSAQHQSGTDRCAEIAEKHPGFDIFINIQGDEPLINPEQIDLLGKCFNEPEVQLATLIKKINTTEELNNPNTPKVIVNNHKQAIYFSRTPIPFLRGIENAEWLKHQEYFKHIGIYAYRSKTLSAITKLPVSNLEKAESLEQLRWIENGFVIQTALTTIESQAIDTPEDVEKILQQLKNN